MQEVSNIIDGRYFAQQILSGLKDQVDSYKKQHGLSPTLSIIMVGNNPESIIYVRNKLKAAALVGMDALQINLPQDVQVNTLLDEINKLNNDPKISGIIVQLPLPQHIDKNLILSAINPSKDVDGFHPINVGYLHSNSGSGFVPCTALGCLKLIKEVQPNLAGKSVVVIGRSNIVGKPLSALLLREDCTVTICHSKSQNLSEITSRADIVVSAMGSPLMLTADYFNPSSIVIDVGITKITSEDKVVGDVDFANVAKKVRYITPVPGGVGPMTVAFLLQNTFKAALIQ